ncbi:MAG: NUDIX domain-containing protein [Patescibacteria group bacterium]|jgi:ADP-ribose pyrophosphatase YjhB (NUDIX family)
MNKIIIVSGAVIIENDKILLNQHGDTEFWKVCGGKMQASDKDLVETAKREAKEELGIDIEILDPEPFVIFDKKETAEGVFNVKLVHYLAKRKGDIIPGSDIREWGWFDINDLPANIAPNIIPALKHFKSIK